MKTGVEAYFDEPADIKRAQMKDIKDRGLIITLAVGTVVVIGILVVRQENARPKESDKEVVAALPKSDMPANVVQGYEFLEDNDLGAAEACFAREIDKNPSYLAFVGSGLTAARAGNYTKAESDFLSAAKLNSQSTTVFMNLAYTKLMTANYADAIEYFSRAISVDPNLASAYGNRARCNFALGQYYDAVDDLSNVIRLDARNAVGYMNRALALGKLNRFETAVTNLLHPAIDELGTQQARKLAALFQAKSRNALDSLSTCKLGLDANPNDVELKLLSLNALKLIADEHGDSESIAHQTLLKAIAEFDLNPSDISAAEVGLHELEHSFQTIGCCSPILLLPSEGISSPIQRSFDAALALSEQADGFLKVGDLESATVCLRETVWNDPGNSEASFKLVLTLIDQRRHEAAQALLAEMISRIPNNTKLLELKSMVDTRLGQFQLAIQSLNRLISLSKENQQAYLQRATVRFLEGSDYEAVLADCDRVQRLGLTDAAVLDLKGRALMKLGKSSIALQAFESAIGLMPEESTHYIHRSACLRSLEKITEATADSLKAIEIAPDSFDAHLELAQCYYAGRNFERTLTQVNNAQRLKTNAETLRLKANTLFLMKRYKDAILAVLEINDSSRTEEDQILLAKSYFETSDLRSAWDSISPYATKSNSTAPALILAGKIACEKREFSEAFSLLDRAIAMEPMSSEAHYLLGKSASGTNDWKKAIEQFRSSLELDEKNVDVWLAAGNAFEKQRMHSKAVACYSKVVAIDSQNENARLARAGVLVKVGDYETAMEDLKWLNERKNSDRPEVERLLKLCTEKLVSVSRR